MSTSQERISPALWTPPRCAGAKLASPRSARRLETASGAGDATPTDGSETAADLRPAATCFRGATRKACRGSVRASKGWSPATISRILDNEKYAGRWVWNKTGTRRDPRTGRRRRTEAESKRSSSRTTHSGSRPAAAGERSQTAQGNAPHVAWRRQARISKEQGSRQKHVPGPLAGEHGLRLAVDLPASLKLKEAELAAEQRRLAELRRLHRRRTRQRSARGGTGRDASAASTRSTDEVDALRRSREHRVHRHRSSWIKERGGKLQDVLEQHTARNLPRRSGTFSAQSGWSSSRPTSGGPFYRAVTSIDALALTETPPAGAEGGSNSL